MRKKFEIGQRVGTFFDEDEEFTCKPQYRGEYDNDLAFGKVAEILTEGNVRVQFDDEYLNEKEEVFDSKTGAALKSSTFKPALVRASVLLPEAEVKKKFSELEKEYQAVSKQVEEKLKVAAKAIREAHKLVKKELRTDLSDMYDVHDILYDAMDAAGWRTSSFGC